MMASITRARSSRIWSCRSLIRLLTSLKRLFTLVFRSLNRVLTLAFRSSNVC